VHTGKLTGLAVSAPPPIGRPNERADEGVVRGSARAFAAVIKDREVWTDLWLEERDDPSDDDMNGGSQCSVQSTEEKSVQSTDSSPDSDSDSDSDSDRL